MVIGTWNWLERTRSEASYFFEAVVLTKEIINLVMCLMSLKTSLKQEWAMRCLLHERQTPQRELQMWSRKTRMGTGLPEGGTRGRGPLSSSRGADLGLIRKFPLPPEQGTWRVCPVNSAMATHQGPCVTHSVSFSWECLCVLVESLLYYCMWGGGSKVHDFRP